MKLPKTINEVQNGLFSKSYTCVDLVGVYLDKISQKDKEINSFLTISEDSAYKKAKAVDSIINDLGEKALDAYPLLGLVVAHKDMFLTKGIRTTAGSTVLNNFIPPYSASIVEKLDETGCITIGKLNQDAWAHGSSGENSDFGDTKNPNNQEYVPGGSSSGSAAAVSIGFCMAATGTDTGGSVRQPASFCGVVGFKPTYGAVSRFGVVAMSSSFDSIGHFTNSVRDSELIFDQTHFVDEKDANLKKSRIDKKAIKKIGIPKEYFTKDVDSEILKNIEEVIKLFKKKGIKFEEISLPHTKYATSVYYIIQPAEVSSNLGRYDGIRYGNTRESFSSEAKRRIILGTYVLSTGYVDKYYKKAMKVRSIIIDDFNKAFSKVDAIISPVSPTVAFKLGEKSSDPLKMYLSDVFTGSANIAGLCGLSIPSGININNLPFGFQLLADKFNESTIFELGKLYEAEISK